MAASSSLIWPTALVGSARGGIAKAACIASALFGTINGSAVANAATVGPVTIPTMKRAGYPPEVAAAVEACSSTGGVLMPPVMGVTAFIMAQMLNIPYAWVAVAAAVPSFLYYFAIFTQLDGFAARHNLTGFDKKLIPSIWVTLKHGWIYVISFGVLLYFLAYLSRAAQSPYFASAILLVLAMILKGTRLNLKGFLGLLDNLGQLLAELGGMMAGIGLIIGALSLVGVAPAFSVTITRLASGNVYVLVLLGALVNFVMGMGLTITACYVILAILLAPALIQFGLDPLAVHLFVMYCAMLSYITPPVAISVFVTATIAQCNPWKVGYWACRLGIMLFILPFVFVLNPSLILRGEPVHIAISVVTAFMGTGLIAYAIEGYLLKIGRIGWVARVLTAAVGLALFYLPMRLVL